MKLSNWIGLAFLFATPLAHASADGLEAEFSKCLEQAESTLDKNLCVEEALPVAEAELNRVSKSQRAWLAQRNAACQKQGLEVQGGTSETAVVGECRVEATLQRIRDLQSLSNSSN